MHIDVGKVTHIIFDWDGTIMDSAAKIVTCMQKAAVLCELPVPSVKAVEHIIGISLLPAVKQLFCIDTAKAEEVCSVYKQVFITLDEIPSPLFTGAHDLLRGLSQKYTLGVATGKARRGLNRALSRSNSAQYFDQTVCADEAQSKPSPDMLKQLLRKWNIQASQTVMIGDTTYDMHMAEQIEMPRIGVSYGVHEKNALLNHKPLTVIEQLTDLHKIFKTT